MKPVYQTVYGKPNGNCFAACIASILEMDLEDVPNFCSLYPSTWATELNKWLHGFGLGALTVAFQDEIPITKGYCCAGGHGPSGIMHSVVMKDMKMVHNPHEGWGEFEKDPVDYTFIIVLDPVLYLTAVRIGLIQQMEKEEEERCYICHRATSPLHTICSKCGIKYCYECIIEMTM